MIRSLCVYCGSNFGADPAFADAARELAGRLAEREIRLVYGGSANGLMGLLADTALAAGGTVTGIIPQALVDHEIAHRGLTTLHVVETMHERKTTMSNLADAFLALPGGAGTLEEIFEQWTWGQLGIHGKPCAFLNLKGYFDPIRAMVDRMVGEGFLAPQFAAMLTFSTDVAEILAAFRAYRPPPSKWISPENRTVRP